LSNKQLNIGKSKNRAFTFRQTIGAGYEAREYNKDIKEGTFIAALDFKIWGNSNNLRCFFSRTNPERNFLCLPIGCIEVKHMMGIYWKICWLISPNRGLKETHFL
jgi:hypothetical protein